MSRDTVVLGVDVETVTVTVEDDGAIVTEERNITLTLVQLHGKSDDIINTEARLVLQAQKIPTGLRVSVCVCVLCVLCVCVCVCVCVCCVCVLCVCVCV